MCLLFSFATPASPYVGLSFTILICFAHPHRSTFLTTDHRPFEILLRFLKWQICLCWLQYGSWGHSSCVCKVEWPWTFIVSTGHWSHGSACEIYPISHTSRLMVIHYSWSTGSHIGWYYLFWFEARTHYVIAVITDCECLNPSLCASSTLDQPIRTAWSTVTVCTAALSHDPYTLQLI